MLITTCAETDMYSDPRVIRLMCAKNDISWDQRGLS
jgi:hypothetical protein